MILGNYCSRNCRFCGVKKGKPQEVDLDEPERVAKAVKRLNLRHTVITSVTRDDLPDGGASIFAQTIRAVRRENEQINIEVLIPDFKADRYALNEVVEAEPDIIGHNIETVPRLYPLVRPEADYQRSLDVLRIIKELNESIFTPFEVPATEFGGAVAPGALLRTGFTKSGLMLGLGEREEEVFCVLEDLRGVHCDLLSLGQYLCPSKSHFPVKEYIHPERFIYYQKEAKILGFRYVAAGPYVRSSYHAEDYLGN